MATGGYAAAPPLSPPAVSGTGLAAAPTPRALVAAGVCLAIGWTVGLAVYLTADVPGDFLGDAFPRLAAVLVVVAAPLALLLAWGELDLSVFGTAAIGTYFYAEMSDSGVAVALLTAGAIGLGAGAAIGVARWLTGAPSAWLTLGVGYLLQAVALRLYDEDIRAPADVDSSGIIRGSGLPVAMALVVLGVTVAIATLRSPDEQGPGGSAPVLTGSVRPRPQVILGFALSGMAAGISGGIAIAIGIGGGPVGGGGFGLVPLLVAAVAIGGVVRGSGLIAPIAATLGAVAARLLEVGAEYHEWDFAVGDIVLGSVLVVCVLVAYGINRAPSDTPAGGLRPTDLGASPAPPYAAVAPGGPAGPTPTGPAGPGAPPPPPPPAPGSPPTPSGPPLAPS